MRRQTTNHQTTAPAALRTSLCVPPPYLRRVLSGILLWSLAVAGVVHAGGAPAPEPDLAADLEMETTLEPGEVSQAPLLRTDRYTLLRTEARSEQRAPLKTPVHIRFSKREVRTIGEAMEALVKGSGYRIAYRSEENCLLMHGLLLSRPLPDALRELGPVSVREGLRALAGNAWRLEVEELGRSVYFRIHPEFYSEEVVTPHLRGPGRTGAGGVPAERAVALIPFGVAEFRTLGAQAQQRVAETAKRMLRSGMRALVEGHSHSRAGWATPGQALRRARIVARALEAAGVPAEQIQTGAVHSNHNSRDAELLHGVRIVALSEEEGGEGKKKKPAPLAAARQSCRELFPQARPQAPAETRFFNVEEGSLKRNIERLLQRFDMRIGRWGLRDGRYEYDWAIPHPYEISAETPDQALEELLDSYGIQPTLNLRDGSVDFSARHAPRRREK